jgi:hypothetical protein
VLRIDLRCCKLLLVLLTAVVGCGKAGMTVPLHGAVKLDGRPLPNATVCFHAQDPEGRDALGSTDADGLFCLSTIEPKDGAFPGNYKVTVQPATAENPDLVITSPAEAMTARPSRRPRRPSSTFPAHYSQLGKTILGQNVPAAGDVVFELQSK